MIDPKSLLPEAQKLLPGVDPKEIMEGIAQFQKTHPDLTNQQAIQALTAYLQQQNQPATSAQAPQGKPFEGLINSLGAK